MQDTEGKARETGQPTYYVEARRGDGPPVLVLKTKCKATADDEFVGILANSKTYTAARVRKVYPANGGAS